MNIRLLLSLLLFFRPLTSFAELGTNSPIPIDYEIELRFVVTETTNGDRAKSFGSASQRTYLKSQMNKVLAQFGARVKFPSQDETWVNDYAFEGSGTGVRTSGDLGWIFNNIPFSYYQPDSGIITVVFCERTPGFDYRGFYQTNGYAYIGGNGVTFFLGDGMLNNNGNMDIVAAVLAHEIGHNFGLRHINSRNNLMNSTIYEGFLEPDQAGSIYEGRFNHGFFSQLTNPELRLVRSGDNYDLKHLRSSTGIDQLITSTDLQTDSWAQQSSVLVDGIFRSGSYSFSSNLKRFFSVTQSAAAGGGAALLDPSRVQVPSGLESIGCCSGICGKSSNEAEQPTGAE